MEAGTSSKEEDTEETGKASGAAAELEEEEQQYVLVSNIPSSLHTAQLRVFFSEWVERARLSCFHYRHRPEQSSAGGAAGGPQDTEKGRQLRIGQSYHAETCSRVHGTGAGAEQGAGLSTRCCLIKLPSHHAPGLLTTYHGRRWVGQGGAELAQRCLLARVKVTAELAGLPELRPPALMPAGNVGTPTHHFLTAIKQCRLPSKLIGKLGLEFPRAERKFGRVPPPDWLGAGEGAVIDRAALAARARHGPEITAHPDNTEDNDTCEEWERHEALHNDVQARRAHNDGQVGSTSYQAESGDLDQQPGTKERLFEEEIELVWEKGGSGLNFYTDAQFWKKFEGDFDEQTADDWDVDTSVYYEAGEGSRLPGPGRHHDRDAQDGLAMRKSEYLRSGRHSESAFSKRPDPPRPRKRRHSSGEAEEGVWQQAGRGVAGRIMAASGWVAGQGLGARAQGRPAPISAEEEGQGPRDKAGLGWRGEPLPEFLTTRQDRGTRQTAVRNGTVRYGYDRLQQQGITSVYTPAGEREVGQRYDRSLPPLVTKFRDQPVKFCLGGVQGGQQAVTESQCQE